MPDLFWQEVIYLFLQPHLLPVQNAVLTKAADIRAKKIKSSQNNFWKRLVITNYGLWTCVDRAELGKTDWREEKQENVVANTEIQIQFEKGGHNPQNKIENLDELDLCFRRHVYFQGGSV